jgi:hypothetical protein
MRLNADFSSSTSVSAALAVGSIRVAVYARAVTAIVFAGHPTTVKVAVIVASPAIARVIFYVYTNPAAAHFARVT